MDSTYTAGRSCTLAYVNNLRGLLEQRGISQTALADHLKVSRGAVNNWVMDRDLPKPAHRLTTAEFLGVMVSDIWPTLDLPDDPTLGLVRAYGVRADVPPEYWLELFTDTQPGETLNLHGFAVGLFPAKVPRFWDVIRSRELAGVRIQLSMIDPTCEASLRRTEEEQFPFDTRAAEALHDFQEKLGDLEGFEIRLHNRPLDLSIYHSERLMIVTTHLFGHHGEEAPTFIYRPAPDDRAFFNKYAHHARMVWEHATPIK